MTPRGWQKWVERYEGRGYRVVAPAYPGPEVEVESLREDPSSIEALTVPAVVEHLEGVVVGWGAPDHHGPLLRGVFAQILLDRGYGAAGMDIDWVPAEDL